MTTTNDRLRSVILVATLVLSVVAGTVAFSGGTVAASDASSVNDASSVQDNTQATDADAGADSGSTFWAGQSLLINAADGQGGETWQIRSVTDGSVGDLVTEFTLDRSGDAVVSTSGLDGDYVVVDAAGNSVTLRNGDVTATDAGDVADDAWEVAVQTFSASVNSTNVTTAEDVALDFESNRGGYNVTVTSEDLSQSRLVDVFGASTVLANTSEGVVVRGQADSTTVIDFAEAGNYTLDLSVTDTDAAASVGVDVDQQGAASYSLPSSFPSDERGDVATFTVRMENTDTATVRFGSPEVNYEVWADVTDADEDGEVTLALHTYETGPGTASSVLTLAADSEDEIANQSFTAGEGLSSPLEAGDYGITVYDSEGSEAVFGTFVLNERSTVGAQPWVAPTTDLADLAEVYGAVSEDDTVAQGDAAVIQVQASGLYDYLELGTEGLSMDIVQTNPGANQDPSEIAAENYAVVPDPANDTFFVVADTSGTQPGQQYRATFTVSNETGDGNGLLPDGASESVNATFSIVESEVAFDATGEDAYVVPQGAVNVSGTSTLAPGTTFQVTARSADANLLQSEQVTVDGDGTWTAGFDFGDVENGTEFTFTNARTDDAVAGLVNADFQAAGQETTTTTTTTETTTTTTTETTTETTTTTTTTETTTEGDGGGGNIPGFGVAVALVALAAAALLAIRRARSR